MPLAPAVAGDWSIVPSPNALATQTPSFLNGTTCVTASDCWAVGYYLAGNIKQTLIEHWDGTSWATVASPNSSATEQNYLSDVTCVSGSDCWAVGTYYNGVSQTLIERWDGTSWSIVTSPNALTAADNFLNGVTCASASDCWAVGYSYDGTTYQALIERWNGVLWTLAIAPNTSTTEPNVLYGVACVSASDCWAVGYAGNTQQTLVERWNGVLWTIVSSANTSATQHNRLYAVTCLSGSNCWAVGYASGGKQQTLTERWDGASWSIVASPNTSASQHNVLNSVTCVSTSDCWAAGSYYTGSNYQTLTERWDGTSWAIISSPNTSATKANLLNGVTCVSTSDCWAIGYYFNGRSYQTLIERWDGTSWAIVNSANGSVTTNNQLFDVACVSASDCWAVGFYYSGSINETLIERWDGTSWTIVPSPNPSATRGNVLFGVTCVSASDCWAVGYTYIPNGAVSRTLILRWDGTSWAVVTSPNTNAVRANTLESVTCVSASDCWAVGYDTGGSVIRTVIERWDGTSWALVASPNPSPVAVDYLAGVTCASASNCWGVGGSHTGSVYQTLIARWDGTSWTGVTSPNTGTTHTNTLAGVTCVSESDCWAVGYYSDGDIKQTLIVRWDGTSWTIVSTPNTSSTQDNRFYDLTCVSASDCWAAGTYSVTNIDQTFTEQTLVERWDGTSWAIVNTPNTSTTQNNSLNGVTCVSALDCWAIGAHGAVDAYKTLTVKYTGEAEPTPTPTPTCTPSNVARSSNGSTTAASSEHSSGGYPALSAINGDHTGNDWGGGTGGWNDNTRNVYPDTIEVDFPVSEAITQINVFTLQNGWKTAGDPDVNTPATGEGLLDFVVQYRKADDTGWLTIPGGNVTGNDKAMRVFTFSSITTTKIRIVVNNARNNWSRIVEVEALGCAVP